jgi:hypothetical protein
VIMLPDSKALKIVTTMSPSRLPPARIEAIMNRESAND